MIYSINKFDYSYISYYISIMIKKKLLKQLKVLT